MGERLAAWADRLETRALPLVVIVGMFAAIVIAVRVMRPEAAPEPLVLSLPPAPGAQPVVLPADTLFAYKESKLGAEAEKKIDELAERLKREGAGPVLVVGHTDRLGHAEANERLSRERAQVVPDRLARALPGQRVLAAGLGSRWPVTAEGQCPGADTPATRQCLAPDRRVEVWPRAASAAAR